MIELTDAHFDDLYGAPAVRAELAAIEVKRQEAVRQYRGLVAFGLILGVLLGTLLTVAGAEIYIAVMVGGAAAFLMFMFARRRTGEAGHALKTAVLTTLAHQTGFTYRQTGFRPLLYAQVRDALFESANSETFTDLIGGADAASRPWAAYEAVLIRQGGKSSTYLFSGLVFALERPIPSRGTILVRSDRAMFNVFGSGGRARVNFPDDKLFEALLEAYADDEAVARGILNTDMRRLLTDLTRNGKMTLYICGAGLFLGLWGPDRFEPGSMLQAEHGKIRVRRIFDDVRVALTVVRRLDAALAGVV